MDPRELRRALRPSIAHRLRSNDADAGRVAAVLDVLCAKWAVDAALPVCANLRNGGWLVDPSRHGSLSARFKSVDGHHGAWAFSLRRPNLHLLPVIARHGLIVIVDCTRSGKRWPDALSKTVPIFAATVNVAIGLSDAADLHVPEVAVGPSERQQIIDRIPDFATELRASTYPLNNLAAGIDKPLRPVFLAPGDDIPARPSDCFPVVCLSASMPVDRADPTRDATYMQGACDDSENWALGLTADLFWSNRLRLLATPDHELPDTIRAIVAADLGASAADADVCPIAGAPLSIALGRIAPDDRQLRIEISVDQRQAEIVSAAATVDVRLTSLRQRARELCGWRSHMAAELVPRAADTPLVVVPQSSEALDSAVTASLLLLCLLDPLRSADGTVVRHSKSSIRARLERIVLASDGRAHLSSFALKRVTETFTAFAPCA